MSKSSASEIHPKEIRILTVETYSKLIAPYGGKLVSLLVAPEERDALRAEANRLSSIQLSERAACDLELLATGALSPLGGFMGEADYARVLDDMRLADGHIFTIPVTLPIAPDAPVRLDRDVALRDNKNDLLAVLTIEEIYEWDLQ